jgi:hypothetical protein
MNGSKGKMHVLSAGIRWVSGVEFSFFTLLSAFFHPISFFYLFTQSNIAFASFSLNFTNSSYFSILSLQTISQTINFFFESIFDYLVPPLQMLFIVSSHGSPDLSKNL